MKRYCIALSCLLLVGCCLAEDWQRLVRGPMEAWVHAEDVNNGQRVLSLAERTLPEITDYLGGVPDGPVTIVVASSEEEFMRLTQGQIPEWGAAAADPIHGTIILKSPRFAGSDIKLERVLAHELAHVLLSRAAGGRSIDRWFDEGFAQVISTEQDFGDILHLARSTVARQIIPLEAIDEVLSFQKDRATLAYRESRAAVSYLIEKYGKGSISRIAYELRFGDFDTAMTVSIGVGTEEFEKSWVATMRQNYRWAVFLDFPVILSAGMVTLFVAAFLLTRRRSRKKLALWEEEARHGME